MTFWDAVVILLAGIGAGTINTVVGSGSLITFPTLVALGYPSGGRWGQALMEREMRGERQVCVIAVMVAVVMESI